MTLNAMMKPLLRALDNRRDARDPVQFWFRDDDAVEPTAPLGYLLELSDRYAIPMTLAVIPAHSGHLLAQRLATVKGVAVAVHGWSHENYAPADEKKQELGLHRPLSETLTELKHGYNDLAQRHAAQFVPLLVPPWNRIDPLVVKALPELGFCGLSTFGACLPSAIPMVNTHVDIMDWKGTRGGRATTVLVNELVALIEQSHTPIGILTHHLVHDKQAWAFLEQLFAATTMHDGARWVSIHDQLSALSPDPGFPGQEQS